MGSRAGRRVSPGLRAAFVARPSSWRDRVLRRELRPASTENVTARALPDTNASGASLDHDLTPARRPRVWDRPLPVDPRRGRRDPRHRRARRVVALAPASRGSHVAPRRRHGGGSRALRVRGGPWIGRPRRARRRARSVLRVGVRRWRRLRAAGAAGRVRCRLLGARLRAGGRALRGTRRRGARWSRAPRWRALPELAARPAGAARGAVRSVRDLRHHPLRARGRRRPGDG